MEKQNRELIYSIAITMLAAVSLLTSGCNKSLPEKPLPSVTVTNPVKQEVTEWNEYSGRLESPQVANVAARVTGIITEAPFQEGSFVNQGDVLFVMDDRPFKAELANKEAAISRAQALFTKADLRLKRYQKVRATGAVSVDDLEQATADFKEAESDLAAAKAAADIARLEAEWTRVRAPISGRISRKLVTEGNNVIGGSGNLTQLTTITSIDPLYAYISVPEDQFHKYNSAGTNCQFRTEIDSGFRPDCVVNFIDSKVNISTGTVQLRGVIPNPNSELKPGMFVRMRLPDNVMQEAILVPEVALAADQDSRYMLVVNPEGIVERRPVKLGSKVNKLRVVTEGIKAEDRVIIAGLQFARPGSKVNAKEADSNQQTQLARNISE